MNDLSQTSHSTFADPAPFWFGNTRVRVRLSGRHGTDGICITEHWMPYGESPPLHIHHREDEVFHILEGILRLRRGNEELVLRRGDIAMVPKGVPHGFRVESPNGARCIVVTQGTDFETMLVEASRPALGEGLPPPEMPDAREMERLARICARNHIELVGAPLA